MSKHNPVDSRVSVGRAGQVVSEFSLDDINVWETSGFTEEEYLNIKESFIQSQLAHVIKSDGVVEFAQFQSLENQIKNGGNIGRQPAYSKVKNTLQTNSMSGNSEFMEDAAYFAETSSTLMVSDSESGLPPEGYLIDPVSRDGTSRTDFGLEPCGGGTKGVTRYKAQPGEKTEVEWIIKNPVKNSHCQIRISRGRSDDPSSYQNLKVEGKGYDAGTGKFKCGDEDSMIEEATVQLPYDSSCPDCTLQWIYEAPGYGKIYQCSDISIVDSENRED
jgi:hypothetical protein